MSWEWIPSSVLWSVGEITKTEEKTMAEWRNVAKVAIMGDGRIDTREVDILRKALFADNKINKSELEFINEIRKEAKSSVKAFDELFIDGVKSHLLADGKIDDADTAWLRKSICGDSNVDEVEKRLLQELKAETKETSAGFNALCDESL